MRVLCLSVATLLALLLVPGVPSSWASSPWASDDEETEPQEEASPGPAVQLSSSCARCHSNATGASAMRDNEGRGIAPHDLWRGTMMANAARDPLWRAFVSAEVAATPSRREAIESLCLSCHAPMADAIGLDDHGTGSLLHVLDCDEPVGEAARDGVSCTICHGITPDGLGSEESFSGGFVLDSERRLFGPHRDPFAMPMLHHTGFTPTFGEHVTDSALCATCHTLVTEAVDPEGRPTGTSFLEQAPYLEWRNSDFRSEPDEGALAATCRDCHVQIVDPNGELIHTRIARNPGGRDFPPVSPRSPYGRHVLVGGNTLVPAILRDHAEELRVEAPRKAFDAVLAATREQLHTWTAEVAIEDVRRENGKLLFAARVENHAGHKLPTGHPIRRVWLRVVVRDEDGEVGFASGRTDDRGRILGADGEPLASELAGGPIEPHRDVVRSADEVATYEAVLADAAGEPTHTLLRATGWVVDDRLLPRGWRADGPESERTAPIGVEGDADFRGGGDVVRYEVALADDLAGEPLRLEVTLLYQSLGARWAAELLRWDTPEVKAFARMYESAEVGPEELAVALWSDG